MKEGIDLEVPLQSAITGQTYFWNCVFKKKSFLSSQDWEIAHT